MANSNFDPTPPEYFGTTGTPTLPLPFSGYGPAIGLIPPIT